MNLETASLILRMEISLHGEGLGPDDPQPEDNALIREAFRLAGHLVHPVYRSWFDQFGGAR